MGSQPVSKGNCEHPVNARKGEERAAGSAPADRQLCNLELPILSSEPALAQEFISVQYAADQTADKALLGSIGSKGRQLGATKGSVAKPVVLLIEKSIDAFLATAPR